MLERAKLELPTKTSYNNYLNNGGRFAYPEYNFVQNTLTNGIDLDTSSQKKSLKLQILGVAELYNIGVSETEILIYIALRKQLKKSEDDTEVIDPRGKSSCCMGDEELVQEILFLTDQRGDRYATLRDKSESSKDSGTTKEPPHDFWFNQ
jgi:hypothetical protein